MDKKQMAIDFANSLNFEEIEKIILYGSVARGEDKDDSDIDILIITNHQDDELKISREIHKKVFDILLKTEVFIAPMILPKDYFKKNKNSTFCSSINRDGIIIKW